MIPINRLLLFPDDLNDTEICFIHPDAVAIISLEFYELSNGDECEVTCITMVNTEKIFTTSTMNQIVGWLNTWDANRR